MNRRLPLHRYEYKVPPSKTVDARLVSLLIKILLFTFTICATLGYSRFLFLGFHPVVQGLVVGLLLGTVTGKLYRNRFEAMLPRTGLIAGSLLLLLIYLVGQWVGSVLVFGQEDSEFLLLAWMLNDFRESIQWMPVAETGDYLVSVNRWRWTIWVGLDAVVCLTMIWWSMRMALRGRASKRRDWAVYRMLLLYFVFLFSLYYVSKPSIRINLQYLEVWKQELWTDGRMHEIYENIDALTYADVDRRRVVLEEHAEHAGNARHPFPEGHLLEALIQIQGGNFYLAKEEVDRAILQTENLSRRFRLSDGNRIVRDQFLAHLYQFRAKFYRINQKLLAAERDLGVAIYLMEETWFLENQIPESGFYPHQQTILERAEMAPFFGLGIAFYERYLTRLGIGAPEQAVKDLEEARTFDLPDSIILPEPADLPPPIPQDQESDSIGSGPS